MLGNIHEKSFSDHQGEVLKNIFRSGGGGKKLRGQLKPWGPKWPLFVLFWCKRKCSAWSAEISEIWKIKKFWSNVWNPVLPTMGTKRWRKFFFGLGDGSQKWGGSRGTPPPGGWSHPLQLFWINTFQINCKLPNNNIFFEKICTTKQENKSPQIPPTISRWKLLLLLNLIWGLCSMRWPCDSWARKKRLSKIN